MSNTFSLKKDLKKMVIEMHSSLSCNPCLKGVHQAALDIGAGIYAINDIFDPKLVLWSRVVQNNMENVNGQELQRCDHALYILQEDEVAELVCERTLAQKVKEVKDISDCKVTVVMIGLNNYFKNFGRQTQNSNKNCMTEIELEMAITDLLVTADCDTEIVHSREELISLIIHFTKALAGLNIKKAEQDCDDEANFYMRGDKKKCVSVTKEGNGMKRLWQQMMAVIPNSSLETSRAICARYKTPLALYEALQSPNAVNEIADIGVARAAVPGAQARRVGPEFARKLQILFTAQDGSVLVD